MAEDPTFADALEAHARERRPRDTVMDEIISDLDFNEIMLVCERLQQAQHLMGHPGFRTLAMTLMDNMNARARESSDQVHMLRGVVAERRMLMGNLNDEILRRTQKR